MTDVFNIDLDSNGYRKNNLDWRKFRESYNRVSATKIERGIKPLPFSLFMKLVGPQKVFNTYVISRRTTDDLDFLPLLDVNDKENEMKNTEMVTKTVEFPGVGLINNTSEVRHEGHKKGTKQIKRDALPVRPAFQRGIRVPGRYFPKPSTCNDEVLSQSSLNDIPKFRQMTQTPRSTHSYTPHQLFRGSKVHTSHGFKTPSFIRGSNSRNVDSSPSTGRPPSWSGVSGSSAPPTLQSMHNVNTNGHNALLATGSSINGSLEVTMDSVNCKQGDQETIPVRREFENGDVHSDLSSVKRLSTGVRHVSFPKSSTDFTTVLQGRPKTLHRRDPSEDFAREPRARTHVGFSLGDT
ncbi:hypothetical protein ACF0H5_000601 [Mactra antiquata]